MARWRSSKRVLRTKSKHGREIFLLWILFIAGCQIFRYFTPADRNDDATILFCAFSIIACIMWVTDNIPAVAAAFAPCIAVALVFEAFSTSKDRPAWLIFFCLFPLLVLYGAYGMLVVVLPGWFIVSCLPFILYKLSFRYLMIRLPRYRRADRFENSKLCDSCCTVLKSSSLLLGSWTILVRTEELHTFYGSIEEMQRSWQGCQLCEALLSQNVNEEGDRSTAEFFRSRNYGTISSTASVRSLSALEKGSLMVRIQLDEHGSFRDAFGSKFTIKLESPDMNKFQKLCIGEGVYL
jgi:hypothetical protein